MKSIYQTMYEELGEILDKRIKENDKPYYSMINEARISEDGCIISYMVGLKNKYAYEILQEQEKLRN